MRRFARIDLAQRTRSGRTICTFRNLLETHKLARVFFEAGNLSLASRGLKLSEGTDAPATILHAPSQAKT